VPSSLALVPRPKTAVASSNRGYQERSKTVRALARSQSRLFARARADERRDWSAAMAAPAVEQAAGRDHCDWSSALADGLGQIGSRELGALLRLDQLISRGGQLRIRARGIDTSRS